MPHPQHAARRALPALLVLLFAAFPLFGQEPADSSAGTTYAPAQSASLDTVRAKADSAVKKNMSHGVPVSKNPTFAAFRSILVPGWGQLYTGHWMKAVAFFGVDAGMVYGAVVQNNRYNDYLAQSQETKSYEKKKQLQNLADFYRDDRNKLIWWTAGVMLLSGFDAYVEAHLYDFRIDPTLGTTPSGDGMRAGIQVTFP